MSDLHLLLVSNRPALQTYFRSLRRPGGGLLIVSLAPLSLDGPAGHVEHPGRADLAAIDVGSDPPAAIEACQELRATRPNLPIISIVCCAPLVTGWHIRALAEAGAVSILGSFLTSEEIVLALERVARGHIVVEFRARHSGRRIRCGHLQPPQRAAT